MMKSYQDILDKDIQNQFEGATEVLFSARPFNWISLRFVTFGDLGWELPLTRVLPLIGITPQMLQPLTGQTDVQSYEQLDCFPLAVEPFQKLAQILKKPVKVCRQDSAFHGSHTPLFTTYPSGKIIYHN